MIVGKAVKKEQEIVFGAGISSKAKKISGSLEKFLGYRTETLKDINKISFLPKNYKNCLKNPLNSMNYHLRKGSSKIDHRSFIDWWTFTDRDEKERLKCFFLDESDQELENIKEKDDLEPFLEDKFPFLGRHGLKHLIGDELWDRRKGKDNLSTETEKALRNGENGKKFEKLFRDLCQSNGLRCYRDTKNAFREYMPKEYKEIKSSLGTLKGIPDFLVDKINSRRLDKWIKIENNFWKPENRFAFVEVKYRTSKLSKKQREMIKKLMDLGIETKLFKGDFKDYKVTNPF